jgi:hypothetical protein
MASGPVFDAVKSFLETNWTATPLRFENEPFELTGVAFVDVEMTGTAYGQESIGASLQNDNRWDEEGVLWLHVLVPVNTGGSQVRTYAKQIADLFRGLTLISGGLEFRDAFIGRGQPGFEDGAYYRVSVYQKYRWMDVS